MKAPTNKMPHNVNIAHHAESVTKRVIAALVHHKWRPTPKAIDALRMVLASALEAVAVEAARAPAKAQTAAWDEDLTPTNPGRPSNQPTEAVSRRKSPPPLPDDRGKT